MKQLIVFALLIFSLTASAQKCRYEVNELDKFTGKMTKQTKLEGISDKGGTAIYLAARREGESIYFLFDWWTCDAKKVTMPSISKGMKMMFLFADNSNVEIESVDNITAVPKNYLVSIPPMYCAILYKCSYAISAEAAEKLMKQPISVIRFYKTDASGKTDYQDVNINKKNSDDIIELLKCVL
jgi:hypothetical protein